MKHLNTICNLTPPSTGEAKVWTSSLLNLANLFWEDQPAAKHISWIDIPLDHAQGEAIALVAWALMCKGHFKTLARVNSLDSVQNPVGKSLFWHGPALRSTTISHEKLVRLLKAVRTVNVNPQSPDGAHRSLSVHVTQGRWLGRHGRQWKVCDLKGVDSDLGT